MSRIVHFELPTDDPERAVQFYTKVFGWKIQKWEGPADYWLISTGDPATPGIDGAIQRRSDSVGGQVTNTIGVESVDDSVAKITANGGTVVLPKMPVPGIGYLAYCTDPEGNTFGVLQPDSSAA